LVQGAVGGSEEVSDFVGAVVVREFSINIEGQSFLHQVRDDGDYFQSRTIRQRSDREPDLSWISPPPARIVFKSFVVQRLLQDRDGRVTALFRPVPQLQLDDPPRDGARHVRVTEGRASRFSLLF